jgi:hypothetical protein
LQWLSVLFIGQMYLAMLVLGGGLSSLAMFSRRNGAFAACTPIAAG